MHCVSVTSRMVSFRFKVIAGVTAAAWLAAGSSLRAESRLALNSPFAPASGLASGSAAPTSGYELEGTMVLGSDISLCLYEVQTKRSHWIAVGESSDGVKVLSFDAAKDTAMVVIGGEQKQLVLRKPNLDAHKGPPAAMVQAPVIVPAPPPVAPPAIADMPPPAPASSSGEQALKEQREARMLVSDLLEIGMQQRKAYQEAKAKAAQPAPPDN